MYRYRYAVLSTYSSEKVRVTHHTVLRVRLQYVFVRRWVDGTTQLDQCSTLSQGLCRQQILSRAASPPVRMPGMVSLGQDCVLLPGSPPYCDMYCMIDMYRLLRAQFSSENIEPPLVGKLARRGFQRAIIYLPQSSFSRVLLIRRYAGRTQLAAEAGSSM